MQQRLRYVRSAPTVEHPLTQLIHIVILVIRHVTTVDTLVPHRIITHIHVLQHVVMDVAQPVLHHITISRLRLQLVLRPEPKHVVTVVVLLKR